MQTEDCTRIITDTSVENTTLLVETCAVFHCSNKKLMNGAQGTDAGVRMGNNLTCSNSFDATKLFSKIVIKVLLRNNLFSIV